LGNKVLSSGTSIADLFMLFSSTPLSLLTFGLDVSFVLAMLSLSLLALSIKKMINVLHKKITIIGMSMVSTTYDIVILK
jgi:hypothetical protein